MLWKPITPVYPRLIQRVPEGLTLEEANEMRKKGRELTPICKLGKPMYLQFLFFIDFIVFCISRKLIINRFFLCVLGKNGVYCDLVRNVREAFEACDIVRINCEGMNGSDYRRIGAKLKVCEKLMFLFVVECKGKMVIYKFALIW